MIFIRKSLWTMCALVALSYQPSQAMETEDHFSHAASPIRRSLLKEVFISEKTDKTNFRDIGINLALVCKGWKTIIKQEAKAWVCDYFKIEEKNKDVFWRLFKGKLIYNPYPNSNEGQVNLFISSMPNLLEGTFDLSNCDAAGQYLSINMGYRKRKNPENANKVEIWVAPRFLLDEELSTTLPHFTPIMDG